MRKGVLTNLAAFVDQIRGDSVTAPLGGWHNYTTGHGTTGDKFTGWQFVRPTPWTINQLSDLYEADSLARRAVSAVVEDALRQGFTIASKSTPSISESFLKRAESEYNLTQLLFQLLSEKRLYGGVLLVPMLADGAEDIAQPLQGGGELRSVQRAEPDAAAPMLPVQDPFDRRFGQPELWRVQLQVGTQATPYHGTFHHTRVHPLHAGTGTQRGAARRTGGYPGWGPSVLEPVLEALRLFRAAMASVGSLFQDASQGVFRIQNLRHALLQGDESSDQAAEGLRAWMQVQNLMRSAINAIALDAGGGDLPPEDFTRVATPMAEMSDLVDRFIAMLAEAIGMPVTRLMGQAPSGLSTDDLSGTRMWFDKVQSFREQDVEPLLRYLLPLMGGLPEDWEIEWPSLWQFTPLEEATARSQVAQADVAYIGAGVFTPEDIARTRGQPDGWRMDVAPEDTQSALEEVIRDAIAASSEPGSTPAT